MNRNQISIDQASQNILNGMISRLKKRNNSIEINGSNIIEANGDRYYVNIKPE